MFQFNLRTLLIVLALGPPVLAGVWFGWAKVRPQRAQVEFDPTGGFRPLDLPGIFTHTYIGPDGKEVVEVWHQVD